MLASPPPPQTTAIYRDFKKSTAISKGYNVGLRYIKVKGGRRRGIEGRERGKGI